MEGWAWLSSHSLPHAFNFTLWTSLYPNNQRRQPSVGDDLLVICGNTHLSSVSCLLTVYFFNSFFQSAMEEVGASYVDGVFELLWAQRDTGGVFAFKGRVDVLKAVPDPHSVLSPFSSSLFQNCFIDSIQWSMSIKHFRIYTNYRIILGPEKKSILFLYEPSCCDVWPSGDQKWSLHLLTELDRSGKL